MACLSNKRNQWSFRLTQELRVAKTAFFVTLTYDEAHNTGELSKRDVQLFLKSLRHDISFLMDKYGLQSESVLKPCFWPKFKYFLVGEYGTKTKRPHYHCIMFNLPGKFADGVCMDITGTVTANWKRGLAYIGSVNPASIAYTTKYCITRVVEKADTFSMMSLKPAIGYDYIQKFKAYHVSGQKFYGTVEDGKKVSLPRYYRDKIFTDFEKRKNKMKLDKIMDLESMKKWEIENPGLVELEEKKQFTERTINSLTKSEKL